MLFKYWMMETCPGYTAESTVEGTLGMVAEIGVIEELADVSRVTEKVVGQRRGYKGIL